MTSLHFLTPNTIINYITFQYNYALTERKVTLQSMQPDSKHLNKACLWQIFKHMVSLERVGSVCVCVCVILLLSTCWAVWQFDQLTRAAQLSPVSPALSIDQQSLRHETATGNLSEGKHLLHNLQHSRSLIRDSLTVFCRTSELYSGTDQWDATDTLHNKLIKVGYENVCNCVIEGHNKMQSVYICTGSLL